MEFRNGNNNPVYKTAKETLMYRTVLWTPWERDTELRRGGPRPATSALAAGPSAVPVLVFLPAILIPACASSSPVFLMMYPAYKLNKQGDNIQP